MLTLPRNTRRRCKSNMQGSFSRLMLGLEMFFFASIDYREKNNIYRRGQVEHMITCAKTPDSYVRGKFSLFFSRCQIVPCGESGSERIIFRSREDFLMAQLRLRTCQAREVLSAQLLARTKTHKERERVMCVCTPDVYVFSIIRHRERHKEGGALLLNFALVSVQAAESTRLTAWERIAGD